MKSKNDPRHQRRIKIIQALFAWSVTGNLEEEILSQIIPKIGEIDTLITQAAPKWPLNQINKVELSILRYAIWELNYQDKTPQKVIIDEAIEISKEFGNETSGSFVNAVLGHILKPTDGQNN